jgi:hypothetical protein
LPDSVPATYRLARFLYLRLLALCLGLGFWSLWQQAPGLIGPHGITPLAKLLQGFTNAYGDQAFWRAPSLFWLCSEPWFVQSVAGIGCLASVLLLFGIVPRGCCVVGYVAWLSFRAIDGGPVFWFNYPYDDLQAEAVFLGIFVAPAALWPWRPQGELPRWVHWLMLWFLFRVMFGPGITKVVYHAPWRELTAVGDFLLTMPHPTAAAAWFTELPAWCLQAMTAFTLLCEVVAPWFFFVPGRARRWAAAAGIVLMVGIQVVCSIRGFQPLTIGLLLLCWDDASLRRLVPARWRSAAQPPAPGLAAPPTSWLRRSGAALVVFLSVGASIGPFLSQFGWSLQPAAVARVDGALQPFRMASCYTMFCIVPQERFGLVVQGSADGDHWLDYEPLGIPARVERPPRLFAPYHDYLGFKLWFAGFCPPSQDDWLRVLQQRLLDDEPAVRSLFANVPFPGAPTWLRVAAFRWRFATSEQRANGQFWVREPLGIRIPAARRHE